MGNNSNPDKGKSKGTDSYPNMEQDLNEFKEAFLKLRIADNVMMWAGDFLEDIYEYDYGYDEYEFVNSGWDERVYDYVYETLGYPEFNNMRRVVDEIAQRIAKGTGIEELGDTDDDWYPNLVDFAEEHGIEMEYAPDLSDLKRDLDVHFTPSLN